MNAIYPGFGDKILAFSLNSSDIPSSDNEINKQAQNIIMGPFVTRVTLRKQKMTHVISSEVDVSY